MKLSYRGVLAALLIASSLLLLGGCKTKASVLPTPTLYRGANLDAITDVEKRTTELKILYATDRAYEPERGADPYPPERERFLRLGEATVRFGSEGMGWEEVAQLTTAAKRKQKLEMELIRSEDFGPHAGTTVYFDPIARDPQIDAGMKRYAQIINEQLANSRDKNITVYVAPFKVSFATAVLTAAEFHHCLGRDGVFIAYSWPTATGTLDYLSAAENAYRTRRVLRIFIEYLAAETDAEQINLMTYSAGARVLSGALFQLALLAEREDVEKPSNRYRIGEVIFCAPDIDSEAFLEHVAEGEDYLAGRTTIYTNTKDAALRMSKFLYGWKRTGQLDVDDFSPQAKKVLARSDRIAFVSVMNAKNYNQDNGHGYFRLSPDVSTDILLQLGVGYLPAERGLVRDIEHGDPVWRFPDDYEQRAVAIRERLAKQIRKARAEGRLPEVDGDGGEQE